jgi:nifR3 family TIM-barrel protein
MRDVEPAFFIKNIPIFGRLILAPMDGISDLPYRSLCRQFGSAISYSSFVGAIEILQGNERAWRELAFLPEERPVALQIFDNDVERLAQASRQISSFTPDMIDINMGCSVRRVSGRGAGAGLLRDPDQISEIMHTLTTDLDCPITAKIRLGWDDDNLNYLDVAQRIEEKGGSLIAVHARTRKQAYGGTANWDAIAEIKAAVDIPVIGNGDIEVVADIDRMLDHTGCDGVMIGRGAIGNPWIFQRQDRTQISQEEVGKVVSIHLGKMLDYYGMDKGLLLFRKHLARYLGPIGLSDVKMRELLTCTDLESFVDLMSGIGLSIIVSRTPVSKRAIELVSEQRLEPA